VIKHPVLLELVLISLLCISGTAPGADPDFEQSPDARNGVLIVGGKAALFEAAVLQALALHPQPAEFDIPAKFVPSLASGGAPGDYKAIIFCAQDTGVPPLTESQVAEVAGVARDGGLIVFLGESLAKLKPSPKGLGSFADVLGAKDLGKGMDGEPSAEALALDPSLGKKTRPWMNGGYALTELTTARVLIGDRKKANAAVNTYGKGTVAFFGNPLSAARPDTGIEGFVKLIKGLILASGAVRNPTARETWELIPLGPLVEPAPTVDAPVKQRLVSNCKDRLLGGNQTAVVRDGRAAAVIVTAREPTAATRQAAIDLQRTIKQISGAELRVLSEDEVAKGGDGFVLAATPSVTLESVILLGDSRWLRDEHVDPAAFAPEGFLHRAQNGVIVIAGNDRRENGLELYGTLYATYDFLERHFGVRWLWPGLSGTVLPESKTLMACPREVSDAPLLKVRKLRNISSVGPGYHEPYLPAFWSEKVLRETYAGNPQSNLVGRIRRGLKLLGKSEDDYIARYAQTSPWFATARAGMSQRLYGTHAYDGWYEKYHQDHPDWFALQANGTREQSPVRPRLNKVNPGMIHEAAVQTVGKFAEDPLLDAAPFSPNDGGANTWDMSEASRKLDPPNGPKIILLYQLAGMKFAKPYVALSDRVVTFYNNVAKEVQKLRPGSRIGTGAYSYYRTPPLHVTLDPSVVLFYTGMNYLNDRNLEKDRANWNGWAAKANEMLLRPNAFHAGHGFPVVWVHKMDQDIKRCYETGMVGSDWDSIIHHWATVGLNYYVLGRLLWDPSQNVDAIVKDYCKSGFGPAAAEMEGYFNELERLTNKMAGSVGDATESALRDEEELDVNNFAREVIQRLAPEVYTADEISKLRGYFARAREKAKDEPPVLERLRFLELGVDYAQIQAEVYSEAAKEAPDKAKVAGLIEKRQTFFSSLFDKDPFAVNLPYIAWREEILYKNYYPRNSK
jgi:hypothetical protein